jgi:protease I
MNVLIISADGFEDSELLVPYYRLQEEGIEAEIASMAKGPITGKHGYAVDALRTLAEVAVDQYDLLVLPGGRAPAVLRREPAAVEVAKEFFRQNKPVAAICHGPQVLITAGLLQGRHATCYRTVADELRASGAFYEDKPVVVDGNLVTSRQPSDLPLFMREIMKMVRARKAANAP